MWFRTHTQISLNICENTALHFWSYIPGLITPDLIIPEIKKPHSVGLLQVLKKVKLLFAYQ
jgi:hypothetical protein